MDPPIALDPIEQLGGTISIRAIISLPCQYRLGLQELQAEHEALQYVIRMAPASCKGN